MNTMSTVNVITTAAMATTTTAAMATTTTIAIITTTTATTVVTRSSRVRIEGCFRGVGVFIDQPGCGRS
jgi:3-deoxy-D-manno-octulosonate 8-phosphate phosphatase KdsC-like HAD superfamily phosphatase